MGLLDPELIAPSSILEFLKKLCKVLSVVAARCSYAIYLAHKDSVWYDKTDLVVVYEDDVPDVLKDELKPAEKKAGPTCRTSVVNNIVYLREKGIDRFYHFTDVANLESIRKHGLMSASNLQANSLTSVMNSKKRVVTQTRSMLEIKPDLIMKWICRCAWFREGVCSSANR